MSKKTIIIAVIVLVLAISGYFLYTKFSNPAEKTVEEKLVDLQELKDQSLDTFTEEQKFDILNGNR